MMVRVLIGVLASFFLALIFSPLVLSLSRRFKAGQPLLSYVEDMHKGKSGTPTMGGVIFVFAIFSTSFMLFNKASTFAVVSIVSMLAFAIIGGLDDFLKVKYKTNLGLRAYQKIIGQGGVAAIISWFVYTNPDIGTKILVPFSNTLLDVGFLIIPFVFFVVIAVTNSVNLTDGLDGLATSVSIIFFAVFAVLLFMFTSTLTNPILTENYSNILIVCGCSVGALLAFLMLNCNKAKIFMGDTGSLALGALIACVCLFTRFSLIIPIIGLMFVASSVSVILQVVYFKATKGKRIFLMAPYHHHLEKKGWKETKIVNLYATISLLVGVLTICIYLI